MPFILTIWGKWLYIMAYSYSLAYCCPFVVIRCCLPYSLAKWLFWAVSVRLVAYQYFVLTFLAFALFYILHLFFYVVSE